MGMEGTNGLSVADALALQKDGDGFGFGNGGFMWVFFLFFLLAWGRGGFGFGNDAAAQGALTRADLCSEFNFNGLQNAVRGLQNGLCDGFYAMNTGMLNGFHGVDNALCSGFNNVNANVTNLGYQMKDCCCETNRNIDALRYENAKNTCDIMQNADKNTQRIIDTMTQNVIQELRDNLQAAQLQLGNMSQTQTLINEIRPVARPAYITCSPYEASNFGRCGNGYNC